MLELDRLTCGYGNVEVVHGLSLRVEAGEIVALIGPNGAGKSSTIQCIAGHVALRVGTIRFNGQDVAATTPQQRVKKGVALAPEGRRLFSDLTVRENLIVGGYTRPRAAAQRNIEHVLELFPRLRERFNIRAGFLSGGEQQMLAIGRALMAEPRLLMIDEVSLGLMPKNVDICYQAIVRLRAEGIAFLLVEQNTGRALTMADRVYVLESGRLVWQGPARQAREDPSLVEAFLGSGAQGVPEPPAGGARTAAQAT